EEHRQHDQRGGHGPADEGGGDAHTASSFTCTRTPGARRSCPSVTTCSPAASPCSTTTSWPTVCPTLTGRDATVPSGCTTKTNFPSSPVCTSWLGFMQSSCRVVR